MKNTHPYNFLHNIHINKIFLLWVTLFLLPILIYGYIVLSYSINIPIYDEYELILQFLTDFSHANGFQDSLSILLKRENDHIPLFPKLFFLVDSFLSAQLDFTHIIYIANAFLLGIFFIFYKHSSHHGQDKLKNFLPIPFLLFQIQHWELVTWAGAALIYLSPLLFCILALIFINRRNRYGLSIACIFAIISSFSAGNGFFILPTIAALLLLQRRFTEFVVWAIFSSALTISYLAIYASQGHESTYFSSLSFFQHPLYVFISFLATTGSAAGIGIKSISIISGFVILSWYLYITYKKYYHQNPVIYFFLSFLLLTSIALAFKRSDFGLDLILLTSRYRIISILIMIASYIAFLEFNSSPSENALLKKLFPLFAILLFILSYLLYAPFIKGRYNELQSGVNGLLHNNPAMAYDVLIESKENKIYIPPAGYLSKLDPKLKRTAEMKLNRFASRFNQRHQGDTTLTLRINVPQGRILDTTMHIFLQKPEVIYLFNSGLTPTSIREILHNVKPDYFMSDIYIKEKYPAGDKDDLNVGK